MQTTLKEIKKFGPCEDGWKTLLKYLGKTRCDDEPISFKTLLDAVGIEDAVWCLRTQEYVDYCLFAADVAESVLPIFQERYPDDDRPRKTIAAIRAYKKGEINLISLNNASSKAFAAAGAAYAVADAAAYAAYAASDAAAYAADAADAAYAATYAVADAAAKKEKWQEIGSLFIKHFI